MKKSIILSLIVILTNIMLFSITKEPKIVWEDKTDKDYLYFNLTQDQSSDSYQYLKVKNNFSIKNMNLIKIDKTGQIRSEEFIAKDKNIPKVILLKKDVIFLFQNNYYLKENDKVIELYDKNDSVIFSVKTSKRIIINSYIFPDEKLVVLDILNKKDNNSIIAYDIVSGEVKYSIDYKSIDKNKPDDVSYYNANYYNYKNRVKFYLKNNRFVCFNDKNDIFLYQINDGKLINKFEKITNNSDISNFYEPYNEDIVYFLSINDSCLCIFNIDSGRLISTIKFSDFRYDIDNLNQIDIKKSGNYFYISINSIKKEKYLICLDINESKKIWEKKLQITYSLDYVENDETIIIYDKKFIYCIDKFTGKNKWVSDEYNNIENCFLLEKNLFIQDSGKKIINFINPQNGQKNLIINYTGNYIDAYKVSDKICIFSDTKNIYNLDMIDAKILWKTEDINDINSIKYIEAESGIMVFYNKKKSIKLLDSESGREKISYIDKNDIVDAFLKNDDFYIVDKKSVVLLSKLTGDLVSRKEFNLNTKFDKIILSKYNNKFVFIDTIADVNIFDFDNSKLSGIISLIPGADFIEAKVIGDYLFLIDMIRAYPGYNGGINPGISELYVIDLKKMTLLYKMDIGQHYLTNIKYFSIIYKIIGGSYYNSDFMGDNTLFYPRKEYYKDNLLIINRKAYQLFPNGIPSVEDINKIETFFINYNRSW